MKAYKNFLKEVKKLDIKVVEYFYLDGFGWIKAKDLDNVPKNVKKTFYWELGTLNESRLKELQSDAVSELALLDNDQLERQLKRLDLLNEFETFHNFIKTFYVKAVDNTYNGLDISDFKLLLEQCFYVEIPDKGNINVEFLTELINQVYFKSSLLNGLKNQTINLLPPQPIDIIQNRTKQETPKTFEELFYNPDLVTPYIDILKELDPPLIDENYNFIGKLKGIICVWIDELQRQGIVKGNYPKERKLFASLIPTRINRFSIDESMFGKYQTKAENNYRTDIKTKVSKIKLSQNSH